MKPIWNDRFEQDGYGQPIPVEKALLAPVREAVRKVARVEHWAVKALFTAILSICVAFVTARLATKHEDPAQVRDIQELHSRVASLELRLKAIEVEARKPVGIDSDHHGIAGTQHQTALNADADQQPPAKP